jgi:quercetin dioxygenase-like cupin family protein
MEACKSFTVFGEPVEILVDSSITSGAFAVMTQTSPPGGGPPPHRHTHEDEIFTTMEGDFEIFDGTAWHPLPQGSSARGVRGGVHGFRNCGKTAGKIQVIIYPAGLEMYLEEISPLTLPQDLDSLLQVSERYGISFPPPPSPTS